MTIVDILDIDISEHKLEKMTERDSNTVLKLKNDFKFNLMILQCKNPTNFDVVKNLSI